MKPDQQPSHFSNTTTVATTPDSRGIAAAIEELHRIDPRPKQRRVIVPMDLLPMWPEIERLAQEGYDELAQTDLPYELVSAFLESPEMNAEGSTPLAERARLFLKRLGTEE